MIVFVVAVCGFSILLNRDTSESAENMEKATFPLVYMMTGDTQINRLHGYAKEMDVTAMRDTLTPLDENRVLDIQIQPYQMKVSGVSFEVISSDGKVSMENTQVTKLTEKDGYINASLQLQDNMLINTEYFLKIQVATGNRDIYYYTRILLQDGLKTKEYVDFATGFYERCLNRTDLGYLAECIEPDESRANDTLAFMDIHCTLNQLTWADLDPQIYVKAIPSIRELNENTATIVMDYMISANAGNGIAEYFNVHEYYRLRYSDTRIFLLDFERTTREIFNPEDDVLITKGLNLGVAGRDIVYKNDSENRYFAFAQEGALWLYDTGSGKMSQVFSFPQEEDSDARDTYNQNDIQIVNVDNEGNVFFLVCGYMNRGRHEGECGVALYYYEAATAGLAEKLFVETERTFALLKRDVDALSYVSADGKFYLMLDGEVFGIDILTREVETVASGINEGAHAVSASGRYFAWSEEISRFDIQKISVIDLDTKEIRTITCEENERIRPLGFMEEDFIYGIANKKQIDRTYAGNEVFPMKELRIINPAGETVKTYSAGEYFVTDATIEEKLITLDRVQKQDGKFVETTQDHIVNSSQEEESRFGVTTILTERKQTETVLRVGKELKPGDIPQLIRSREVVYEDVKNVPIAARENLQTRYFVYAKGELDNVYDAPSIAVKRADERLGVVLNDRQQPVWERGNKKTKTKLVVENLPPVVHRGEMNLANLEAELGKQVLDLRGCSLDAVLYYVSEGTPVLAQTKDGVVIIVGYDEYNTILLKPGETETYFWGLNDSKAMFEEAENVFITYLDPIE